MSASRTSSKPTSSRTRDPQVRIGTQVSVPTKKAVHPRTVSHVANSQSDPLYCALLRKVLSIQAATHTRDSSLRSRPASRRGEELVKTNVVQFEAGSTEQWTKKRSMCNIVQSTSDRGTSEYLGTGRSSMIAIENLFTPLLVQTVLAMSWLTQRLSGGSQGVSRR